MKELIIFLNFCMFCFIFLLEESSSIDLHYEACEPKHCRHGPNISFPFYLEGQQESYCGYPGYELNCNKDGYPTIHMPENDYVVNQIFHHNRSFRIYNAALLSWSNSCLTQIRNITLPSGQFSYVDASWLYLLSNCTETLPQKLRNYKVPCDDEPRDGLELAMLENDGNLNYAMEECGATVVAPVEVHGYGGSNGIVDYEGMLKRGFGLNWTASDCTECEQSGGRCGFNSSSNQLRCLCPDRIHHFFCKGERKTNLKVMLATGFSASGTIVAIILYLYFIRKRFPGKSITFWKKTEDCENIEAFLKMFGSLGPRRYSYSHVKKITNSFKDKLGQGGYGCVYKGMLHDGSLVAVKVLHESKGTGEEFVNEVASISRTSHVNIVSLLGFCFEGSKRALIFEFMPNGSLEKFIYNENSTAEGEGQLGWENLFQIAVGIARGLEYLHRGCNTRILHFDIKPHNILLDKDFHPKISDFGLAKLCPGRASQVSLLGARGTIGYIAPEVFSRNFGEVSHKSDVYSYGMMVMEMVGGRKNADAVVDLSSAGFYFPHWICQRLELEEEIGLQGIRNEEEYERARKMIIVGLWCIQTSPVTRPSMSRVVEMLEGSVENLQIPPKPILSLPPILAANSITTFCSHSELLELL